MRCYTADLNDIVPGFTVQMDAIRPYVQVGEHQIKLSDELLIVADAYVNSRLMRADVEYVADHDGNIREELVPESGDKQDGSILVLFGYEFGRGLKVVMNARKFRYVCGSSVPFKDAALGQLSPGGTIGRNILHTTYAPGRWTGRFCVKLFGSCHAQWEYEPVVVFDGQKPRIITPWELSDQKLQKLESASFE
jgi:hypothetical protein